MITGLHHVTAICRNPQRNRDFYGGLLGLRLVKRTVNFDDPASYHLYYGDELGRPGTIMTFFAWPDGKPGVSGVGQTSHTAFSIPPQSVGFWKERLAEADVAVEACADRFGEEVMVLSDPDGLRLELVAVAGDVRRPSAGGSVPAEAAIRGLHAVTLVEQAGAPTVELLTGMMGFRELGDDDGRVRLEPASVGGAGRLVDILVSPDGVPGEVAVGSVHHVAWRTPEAEAQEILRSTLLERGVGVTGVLDRTYFRSIYFREPGGALFEVATDGPGFTADEAPELLGSALKLPDWLESDRLTIENQLPPLGEPEPPP